MCIFCFLDNYKQSQIRNGIQFRTDRFEHALNKYNYRFLSKLQSYKSNPELCSKYDTSENLILRDYILSITESELNDFFQKLQSIYISWIDSKPLEAITSMKNLLKEHNILSLTTSINDKIYFRGRVSTEFISHWDMFHIPFNRRFLIGNQRYSLIGQPLLYLSTSPYCVFKELNTFKDVQLSSFRLKDALEENLKTDSNENNSECTTENNLILFDNTNHFYDLITNNNENPISLANKLVPNINISEDEVKSYFFQYILACCCSFPLKNLDSRGGSFCEEYVLPQILAQVVKEKAGIDGIIFDSTRVYDDELLCHDSYLYNNLCKNICIFTNYDRSQTNEVRYVYDKELYYKFTISSTVNCNSINIKDDYYNLEKSLQLISKIQTNYSSKLSKYHNNLLEEINRYLILYDYLNKKINTLNKTNQKKYNILINSIKLHTLLLRNIILNIKDCLL